MKKLYTMITILLLSTNVFAADPTVVVPPSPIIPTMTTVTPNEVTSAAEPLTNMVFINESGSTPNINITQTGTNNNLGVSALAPFMFTGDNQIFTSIQTGTNNSITGGIYGGMVGITTTIQQIGNSNGINFNCGDGTNANCDKSTFNWSFAGNSNQLYYNGGGESQNSAIDVNGNSNYFNMSVQSPYATQNLSVTGSSNTFNVTQTNGAALGNSLAVSLIGTGNNVTTSQTGIVDNVINIRALSNNGNYVVNQSR